MNGLQFGILIGVLVWIAFNTSKDSGPEDPDVEAFWDWVWKIIIFVVFVVANRAASIFANQGPIAGFAPKLSLGCCFGCPVWVSLHTD